MIEIAELTRTFGDREVLRGVNLNCAPGSTTVILGGSGAGKSVLMKHVVGLLRPESGRVVVDGVDIGSADIETLRALRSRMGMVFQQSALFDSMTIFQNVAFPIVEAAREKIDKATLEERVRKALEMFDLGTDVYDLTPAELSGGMRKRVGLARAVIRQPKILLYDEPTTGLDPITTKQVDDMIVAARAKLGVTSLVISHDIASAFRIADQVAFLYHGRMLVAGTVEEIQTCGVPEVRDFLATWRGEV